MRSIWNVLNIVVILFACQLCMAQSNNFSFQIQGKINGIETGKLEVLADDAELVLHAAVISNGQCMIGGSMTEAKQYLFRITPGNWSFKAFIEPGESTLQVDTAGAQRYGKSADDPNSWALISEVDQCCTPMAKDYKNFLEETHYKKYGLQIKQAYINVNNAKRNDDSLGMQKYLSEIDSLQNQAFMLWKQWIDHFISTNPQSPSGPFLLFTLLKQAETPTWKYYEERMQQFKEGALQTYYYRQLEESLVALGNQVEGSVAPDFTLVQPNGDAFTLSSLRGKYVLLDFWASWCGPCRKEIPEWKKLYASWSQKNIEFVGVSGDTDQKDWRKALTHEKMPWIQVVDSFPSPGQSGNVSDLFGIRLIPHYILLDKDGKVLLGTGNAEAIRERIRLLLE